MVFKDPFQLKKLCDSMRCAERCPSGNPVLRCCCKLKFINCSQSVSSCPKPCIIYEEVLLQELHLDEESEYFYALAAIQKTYRLFWDISIFF